MLFRVKLSQRDVVHYSTKAPLYGNFDKGKVHNTGISLNGNVSPNTPKRETGIQFPLIEFRTSRIATLTKKMSLDIRDDETKPFHSKYI